MSPVELIALSLGASVVTAAFAGLAAAGLERVCADPALRERVWAMALYIPILPPVMVSGVLLTPAPTRVMPVASLPAEAVVNGPVSLPVANTVVVAFNPDWGLIAAIALGIAILLGLVRLASLGWRTARLQRLIAGSEEVLPSTASAVTRAAREMGIAAPSIRATGQTPEALLTGALKPVLVLPEGLTGAPDSLATRAVIRHELAHLKRGDHRAVWLEEAVMVLLAFNLILPLIRNRRAAAREEACDAVALDGADVSARRAYAQDLIEALRARTTSTHSAPALTFTGTPRSQAMRRLKSILTPSQRAGGAARSLALASGIAIASLAFGASVSMANQREPSLIFAPQEEAQAEAQAAARAAAQAASASLPKETQAEAQAGAQAAARAAAQAALASLPREVQDRYRNPTVAQFRTICSSGVSRDEAFCSGVLFGNLPRLGETEGTICPPVRSDGKVNTASVAILGRQSIEALPVQPGETINGVAKAALQAVFPCNLDELAASQLTPEQTAILAVAIATRLPHNEGNQSTKVL